MSSIPLADIKDLSTIAKEAFAYKYVAVATITIFIYDYLCTLHEEIYLVWPSRWSSIKFVFFLNRAIAFTSSILLIHLLLFIEDGDLCKPSLYATVLLAEMTFVTGEIVLFMRVYAIWHCSKAMGALLVLVYVPGVVGSTYATVRATSSATAVTIPGVFGPGCLIGYTSTDFWICYLILLFHETLMLSLILIKAFLHSGYSFSRILRILVKDGIFYYLCVLGTSIGNLLVLLLATKNLRIFLILTQGVIHSILCARLLLRLRGAYASLTPTGLRSSRMISGLRAQDPDESITAVDSYNLGELTSPNQVWNDRDQVWSWERSRGGDEEEAERVGMGSIPLSTFSASTIRVE